MVGNVIIGVIIALAAAFAGGWIGINTEKEIKKYAGFLNYAKELVVLLIGIMLVLFTPELTVNTLVIVALGALTTTILNKFWLGKASRYFEIALLGLATGAAFTLDVQFGFVLVALVALYNLIAESVATVLILHKRRLVDDLKGIAFTQTTFVFGAVLSILLFTITKATPISFLIYIGGSVLFLVFEPRISKRR